MNMIEVQNLVKRYGDFTAIDGVSFTVAPGDFFGFLGPNGAGKTTTMRILATLLKKTSGEARVNGHDVDRDPNGVRRGIGFAMQEISLDNMASGWENLQLLGVLYGLTPKEARARAGELLEIVGLTKVADQWVTKYSGGMRRRLDLAGVLMHSPPLLFLDEPTQGLDPQARRVIWDYIKKLNADGATIFLTTHYMDEADALCRELAFVDKGKIVRQGSPAQLKEEMGGDLVTLKFADEDRATDAETTVRRALGPDARIDTTDSQIRVAVRGAGALVPRLIAALGESGNSPVALSLTEPSLEDVFVKLVGRSIADETSQLVEGRDPFIQGRQ
jgi:ABC-2 type transport system ATP-binding protein